MNINEIMTELEALGKPHAKKVFLNHGAREPFYGVSVEDLKKIAKRYKKNHELSVELYKTGNSDAMYLAGLIADPGKMSVEDIEYWVENAYWYMLSEYTVAWVASEHPEGWLIAMKWIDSGFETKIAAGWAAISSLISFKPNSELDVKKLKELVDRVESSISAAPNRAKYCMNNFIISVAIYIKDLTEYARAAAARIGKVKVDMGGTSCKVPFAPEYIKKSLIRNPAGKKRKSPRC